MTDPNGVRSEIAEREASGDLPRSGALAPAPTAQAQAAPQARALEDEDPVEATKRQLSQSPGFAGKDFEAGAVRRASSSSARWCRRSTSPSSSAA